MPGFPQPPALLGRHAVDHGVSARERLSAQAFFTKAEAAEECPDGLVRGLGQSAQPAAAELPERVGEDRREVAA